MEAVELPGLQLEGDYPSGGIVLDDEFYDMPLVVDENPVFYDLFVQEVSP